jgi:hypothetical protein
MGLIRKITLKTMGCDGKAARKLPTGERIHLADVMGEGVSGLKGFESEYGVGNSLLGMFTGMNAQTGEIFQAGKAILPGAAQELIEAQVSLLAKGDRGVDFAVRIFAVEDEASTVGYTYQAEFIQSADQPDPAEKMAALFGGVSIKKISAPKAKRGKAKDSIEEADEETNS